MVIDKYKIRMRNSYLWFTDTHFDKVLPWNLVSFIKTINRTQPKGIFLTGDISNGWLTSFHLELLAKYLECPIYFVLGNHDLHFTQIEKQKAKIKNLCQRYPNLIWMSQIDAVNIDEEVCLIGTEGWYDCAEGKPQYLRFTLDWILTKDFRQLSSMEERIEYWRQMANDSVNILIPKLEKCLQDGYKNIYLLTHFPPWKEATRDIGTMFEPFWLPYNTNVHLGKALEQVMENYKKRNLTVLCGHTHAPQYIRVSRNISCQVGDAKLFKVRSQTIII